MFSLSKHDLNPYEKKVLEKGLSFCPEYIIDNFQLFLDFHQFMQNLTLKRFFAIQEKEKRQLCRKHRDFINIRDNKETQIF